MQAAPFCINLRPQILNRFGKQIEASARKGHNKVDVKFLYVIVEQVKVT